MKKQAADAVVEMRSPGRIPTTNTCEVEVHMVVTVPTRSTSIVFQCVESMTVGIGSLGSAAMTVSGGDQIGVTWFGSESRILDVTIAPIQAFKHELDSLIVVSSDVGMKIDVPNAYKEVPTPRFFWG
jgi:hypothetical protein